MVWISTISNLLLSSPIQIFRTLDLQQAHGIGSLTVYQDAINENVTNFDNGGESWFRLNPQKEIVDQEWKSDLFESLLRVNHVEGLLVLSGKQFITFANNFDYYIVGSSCFQSNSSSHCFDISIPPNKFIEIDLELLRPQSSLVLSLSCKNLLVTAYSNSIVIGSLRATLLDYWLNVCGLDQNVTTVSLFPTSIEWYNIEESLCSISKASFSRSHNNNDSSSNNNNRPRLSNSQLNCLEDLFAVVENGGTTDAVLHWNTDNDSDGSVLDQGIMHATQLLSVVRAFIGNWTSSIFYSPKRSNSNSNRTLRLKPAFGSVVKLEDISQPEYPREYRTKHTELTALLPMDSDELTSLPSGKMSLSLQSSQVHVLVCVHSQDMVAARELLYSWQRSHVRGFVHAYMRISLMSDIVSRHGNTTERTSHKNQEVNYRGCLVQMKAYLDRLAGLTTQQAVVGVIGYQSLQSLVLSTCVDSRAGRKVVMADGGSSTTRRGLLQHVKCEDADRTDIGANTGASPTPFLNLPSLLTLSVQEVSSNSAENILLSFAGIVCSVNQYVSSALAIQTEKEDDDAQFKKEVKEMIWRSLNSENNCRTATASCIPQLTLDTQRTQFNAAEENMFPSNEFPQLVQEYTQLVEDECALIDQEIKELPAKEWRQVGILQRLLATDIHSTTGFLGQWHRLSFVLAVIDFEDNDAGALLSWLHHYAFSIVIYLQRLPLSRMMKFQSSIQQGIRKLTRLEAVAQDPSQKERLWHFLRTLRSIASYLHIESIAPLEEIVDTLGQLVRPASYEFTNGQRVAWLRDRSGFMSQPHTRVHYITVATHSNPELETLLLSANISGIHIEVLGMGQQHNIDKNTFSFKSSLIASHLQTEYEAGRIPDNGCVVLLDAFDVFVLPPIRYVTQVLADSDTPVLFGSESTVIPDPFIHYGWIYRRGSEWSNHERHINTGCVIGRAGHLRHIYGHMKYVTETIGLLRNDQLEMQMLMVDMPHLLSIEAKDNVFANAYLKSSPNPQLTPTMAFAFSPDQPPKHLAAVHFNGADKAPYWRAREVFLEFVSNNLSGNDAGDLKQALYLLHSGASAAAVDVLLSSEVVQSRSWNCGFQDLKASWTALKRRQQFSSPKQLTTEHIAEMISVVETCMDTFNSDQGDPYRHGMAIELLKFGLNELL